MSSCSEWGNKQEALTMSNTNHTERLWSYWRRRCNHPLCRPFPHLYYWDSSKRKQICWDPWDHRCTAWCLNCQQNDSCVHFSYFRHNRHGISASISDCLELWNLDPIRGSQTCRARRKPREYYTRTNQITTPTEQIKSQIKSLAY